MVHRVDCDLLAHILTFFRLADPVITPELFAGTLIDDYQLPLSYHAVITKSIQEQLSDFKAQSLVADEPAHQEKEPLGGVHGEADEDEDAAWWESWRKRLRTDDGYVRLGKRAQKPGRRRKSVGSASGELLDGAMMDVDVDADVPMDVDEWKAGEELRIAIKLDILVGHVHLEDQFEWELGNVVIEPEWFAEVYATELGLPGEFKYVYLFFSCLSLRLTRPRRTAIAHSIREQTQTYQKSLFTIGHPSDGTTIQDEELRLSFLPSLHAATRPPDQVGSFMPLLNYLSDGEIERTEREREKEMARRRKRAARGRRGVALPDREPMKTHRTPAIGFPEVDPALIAIAAAAAAPTSRRAAAAAAQLTIANMVASENGGTVLTQSVTATPTPTTATPKEKKVKGLFRAPPYPDTVLRPRAKVPAPTASTALVGGAAAADASDAPTSMGGSYEDRKGLTVKRLRELEREAKEKEYAEGQHQNMIDGVWHCSNCGCPESIAVGRRKGPLGDKSQCGECGELRADMLLSFDIIYSAHLFLIGKYWHRHRRPRPCEYHASLEYHLKLRAEADRAKAMAKKRGGAAALRAIQAGKVPGTDTPVSETPRPEAASTDAGIPAEENRAASPAPSSSGSSTSESPLAQRLLKANGASRRSAAPVSTTAPPAASPKPAPSVPPSSSKASAPPETPKEVQGSAPPSSATARPEWLIKLMADFRGKYPTAILDAKMANGNWYLKCGDCPMKVRSSLDSMNKLRLTFLPLLQRYKADEKFEAHLKHRDHMHNLNNRLKPAEDA